MFRFPFYHDKIQADLPKEALRQIGERDRALEDYLDHLPTGGGGAGDGDGYDIIFAAYDSSAANMAIADVVCDYTNDGTLIQAAIDALDTNGMRLLFLPGQYRLFTGLTFDTRTELSGAPWAEIQIMTSDTPGFTLNADTYFHDLFLFAYQPGDVPAVQDPGGYARVIMDRVVMYGENRVLMSVQSQVELSNSNFSVGSFEHPAMITVTYGINGTVLINNCRMYGDLITEDPYSQALIVLDNVYFCSVSDNVLQAYGGAAVVLRNQSDCKVSGNIFMLSGSSSDSIGVLIETGQRNMVTDNMFRKVGGTDYPPVAVVIDASSDDTLVTNNDWMTTTGLTDAGTGTVTTSGNRA